MAAFPNNLVITFTETVPERTKAHRNTMTDKGWVRLEDFYDFGYKGIKNWVDTIKKRTVARGGVNFASVALKKLQALSYWCNQLIFRVETLDCTNLNTDVLRQSMEDF